MISNNKNDILGRRQQGEFIVALNGEFHKHATSKSVDPTGLGRWSYVDSDNVFKNLRFTSARQSEKLTSLLGTVYCQRKGYFSKRHQHVSS